MSHHSDRDTRSGTYSIAIEDNSPHARIDHRLEIRPRVPHPVARVPKVIVHIVIGLLPVRLGADLRLQRRVGQVGREVRRVRIRVLREDVVDVVVACECIEHIVVAVVLGVRAGVVRAAVIARGDLHSGDQPERRAG